METGTGLEGMVAGGVELGVPGHGGTGGGGVTGAVDSRVGDPDNVGACDSDPVPLGACAQAAPAAATKERANETARIQAECFARRRPRRVIVNMTSETGY